MEQEQTFRWYVMLTNGDEISNFISTQKDISPNEFFVGIDELSDLGGDSNELTFINPTQIQYAQRINDED